VNDQPWAITVFYDSPGGPLLTVRTVRAADDFPPYAMPIEDLPTALGAFASLQARAAGPRDAHARFRTSLDIQAAIDERARHQRPQAATVDIDAVSVAAERLDHDDLAAVHVPWHGQTVLCAGLAQAVTSVPLRTGRVEDLLALV